MSFQEEHLETEDFVVDLTCEERDDVLTTETNDKTAAVPDQEVSERRVWCSYIGCVDHVN